jgi:hypothetical protein
MMLGRSTGWTVPAAVVLGLNSAYLALRQDPTPFYFASIVAHLVLGLALAVSVGPSVRRRFGALAPGDKTAAALLFGASALGLVLMVTGTTRPYRPLLWVHIALAATGALVLVARAAAGAFAWLPKGAWIRELAILSFAAAALTPAFRYHADFLGANGRRIVNPALPPLSMEGEGAGPSSPFFPSSSDTNTRTTIPANFFMTSQTCAKCHKDIYDQWNASAHHFSSFNNQWYRKSIEYMQDVVGTKPSKWCAGCHDHAVFFNGRFDRPIKEQIDTPEAQNGLGCTSCHSIVHVRSTMGQGDFEIEYPPLHDLAVSDNPILSATHDYLLKLDPAPHRRVFLKTMHRQQTADFCSSCHKVHLDVPVNDYRWFRGFNDYDNWQASGMSGEGARSFYYPPKPQKCADCHMPLVAGNDPVARDGKVKSHRFPAANTALPFVNGDHEQLKVTQDFLKDGVVSVDVFGLVPGEDPGPPLEQRPAAGAEPKIASTFAVGEEGGNLGAAASVLREAAPVIAPLGKVDASLRRGESARVEVVVRTRKIGHFFPGGTVDAFDVWVELEATDSNGKTIFHSGEVTDGGKGPVEPGAHFYRSLLLDERGNPINKRNAWAARSLAYVRLIPPGAADTNVTLESTGSNQYDQSITFKDPGGSWVVGQRWQSTSNWFGIGTDGNKDKLILDPSGNMSNSGSVTLGSLPNSAGLAVWSVCSDINQRLVNCANSSLRCPNGADTACSVSRSICRAGAPPSSVHSRGKTRSANRTAHCGQRWAQRLAIAPGELPFWGLAILYNDRRDSLATNRVGSSCNRTRRGEEASKIQGRLMARVVRRR